MVDITCISIGTRTATATLLNVSMCMCSVADINFLYAAFLRYLQHAICRKKDSITGHRMCGGFAWPRADFYARNCFDGYM